MSICTKPNIPQEYKQRTLSKLRRSLKRFKTARTSKRQDLYYSRLFNQNLPIEVVQLIGSWLPAWDYLKLRRANRYFSQLDKIPCLRYCAYIETEERLKKSYQLITEYRIKLSSESMTCDSLAYIAEACHAKEFVRILNTIEISQQHARSLFISVIDDDWELFLDNDDSLDPRNLAARDIIIALLNHGVDPTLADNNCIKWACMMGWVNVLLLLLKNKDVDITADDSDCIRKAAVNGRVELLQLLAADERFPSTGFCDALNAAADVDENQVIEFILNTPAFNHADEDALGFRTAAEYGHVDHVRHGLNSSLIDPGILENEAIRFAAGNGHVEIVKLLIGDPRVDPSDCDDDALREAAGHGHLEVVKLLIEDKRVDPSSWNFEALGRAAEEDHQEIFTLLSQRCDMMQMVKQIQQKLEFYNDFVTHWS